MAGAWRGRRGLRALTTSQDGNAHQPALETVGAGMCPRMTRCVSCPIIGGAAVFLSAGAALPNYRGGRLDLDQTRATTLMPPASTNTSNPRCDSRNAAAALRSDRKSVV